MKSTSAHLLMTGIAVLFLTTAVCQTPCDELLKALGKEGIFEYSETQSDESRFTSMITYYKMRQFETYEEAKSAGLSVSLPIESVLVGLNLEASESGYRQFMQNIDYYKSYYSRTTSAFKGKWKTINSELIGMLEDCYERNLEGVAAFPVYTDDPSQVIIRFSYHNSYHKPKKIKIRVTGRSDSLVIRHGKNGKQEPRRIIVRNNGSTDVLIQRLNTKPGSITFQVVKNIIPNNGLSFNFPAIPTGNTPSYYRTYSKTVLPAEFSYLPPRGSGSDADFDGKCDVTSHVSLSISKDSTKLLLDVYMNAREPESDWTKATGTGRKVLFDTGDPQRKIIHINGPTTDRAFFQQRSGHEAITFIPYARYANFRIDVRNKNFWARQLSRSYLKRFKEDFSRNGLISKWVFVGDTKGNEAGTRTQVTVFTEPISLTVKEYRGANL